MTNAGLAKLTSFALVRIILIFSSCPILSSVPYPPKKGTGGGGQGHDPREAHKAETCLPNPRSGMGEGLAARAVEQRISINATNVLIHATI